ncbi:MULTISPECIES: glycosyltransferase family 39 protein [unclassified Mucilaginibacter]|uniref:ArnT family glycosyltransferase n=1 Tax=unclassified Mucilaginibacter TaxID=2617802 RepID=UPI002AC9B121|nr:MULTISPECIES: glycosyltransferase family 39 protein [unclassified Mucilaginibacter]MEB0262372.1 glycosyltransferase family 39 protein [Mucilaginibacter sp. 10I4]MEB0280459.1 glycosyltransferase family 39 protein [Mucilaginibacter sp. 10B2]MEB0300431.1 glycosyltransferase family 39 protein [Mucilaginibacter sp. 5C4]WPX23134.1 glycosyltransferase family 39 protein [Mucilaginibacter sp. 5C4]
MQAKTAIHPIQSNKPIWYFMLCWTLLNAIQAYTLEIHADEAYYWLYSRFLDWGYFDHPPMVALFIKAGYSLFHNEFGVRILTILSNSVCIYVMWLMVKQYGVKAKWFILLVSGLFIFHIYGFTTTPDVPLFLFTVLFYYVYKKYLKDDDLKYALLLAIIIACLLYSKYHGVLLIVFTLASNILLLKRRSFWLIVLGAIVLFIPHIWWQVSHGYPSVKYHLFERNGSDYSFARVGDYIPAQLAMGGPLIGWFVFYAAFRNRITDVFTRTLVVNAAGTFIFFLLSTIKGGVEAHWTLIAFVPLVMLALIYITKQNKPYKWLSILAIINIVFIVGLRIGIMFGPAILKKPLQLRSYYGFKDWAHKIKEKAGDSYVVFSEGFQNPSKYDFYNNTTKGFSYDARDYRRTQFSIWPIEDSLQRKRVYLVLNYYNKGVVKDTIQNEAGTWYGGWVDDVRTYQKIIIDTKPKTITAKPGQKVEFDLSITNPYPFAVNFTNVGYKHPVYFETCFFEHTTQVKVQTADSTFNKIALQKNQSTGYKVIATAPTEKGTFDLFFSLRTEPFTGSRNSRIIKFVVE